MSGQEQTLEQIWDGILSREEVSIRRAYFALDKPSRDAVLRHLQKMAQEKGWHPEQVKSAKKALEIIQNFDRK